MNTATCPYIDTKDGGTGAAKAQAKDRFATASGAGGGGGGGGGSKKKKSDDEMSAVLIVLIVILLVVVLCVGALACFFFNKSKNLQEKYGALAEKNMLHEVASEEAKC